MKKVIVCLTIAVAAVCANAASFNWSAANIYQGDTKANNVAAYLVFADKLSTADATSALASGKTDAITGVASQNTTVANGVVAGKNTTFDRADAEAGKTYEAYFVVFSDDGTSYYMSGTVSGDAQATSTVLLSFGNQAGNTQGKAWTKIGGGSEPTPVDPSGVPEPTSGLLLLVGGAALALRRKQK